MSVFRKIGWFVALVIGMMPMLLQAQSDEMIDIVYLKNGSVIKGQLVSYEQGGMMRFQISENYQLEILDEEIERIVQGVPEDYDSLRRKRAYTRKPITPYLPAEDKWYSTAHLSTSFANSFDGTVMEAGLQTTFGCQFSQWLGAGVGTGFVVYNVSVGEMVIPLFAEVRGYFKKTGRIPFYTLVAGYGWALKNESNWITEAEGGLMYGASLGWLLPARGKNPALLLDVGYRSQKASFTTDFDFWNEETTRNYNYHRIVFRAGMLF